MGIISGTPVTASFEAEIKVHPKQTLVGPLRQHYLKLTVIRVHQKRSLVGRLRQHHLKLR